MAPPKNPPGLQHLTLRQIAQTTRQHSEAPFKLNNVPINRSIIIVANIVGLERVGWEGERPSISYQLDDESDTVELEHLQYVHILGHLHYFTTSGNTYKSINIETIRPIESPQEILHHIVRTMATPLVMAHGPPSPVAWSTRRSESLDQKLDQELARETDRLAVSSPFKPSTPPTPSRPASTSPSKPLPRLSLIQSQSNDSASASAELSIHSDPLSGLTDLQREIMLCIMRDNSANIQSNHIYPDPLGAPSSTHWVSLDVPMLSIQNNPRHRDVSMTEFIGAIDFLVLNGHLKESPKGDYFSVPQPRKP
ncbi:OB domain-containing protein [Pleurotus pulmonarius]